MWAKSFSEKDAPLTMLIGDHRRSPDASSFTVSRIASTTSPRYVKSKQLLGPSTMRGSPSDCGATEGPHDAVVVVACGAIDVAEAQHGCAQWELAVRGCLEQPS